MIYGLPTTCPRVHLHFGAGMSVKICAQLGQAGKRRGVLCHDFLMAFSISEAECSCVFSLCGTRRRSLPLAACEHSGRGVDSSRCSWTGLVAEVSPSCNRTSTAQIWLCPCAPVAYDYIFLTVCSVIHVTRRRDMVSMSQHVTVVL